jgi:predicted permease
MMLLGANICFMQKNLKARAGSSLGFVFLRQLAAPLTVFLLSRLVVGESQALLLMLLAGIPTMTTTGLLAIEYHTDVDYASNLVFVSTILSLATLPLIALISGYL